MNGKKSKLTGLVRRTLSVVLSAGLIMNSMAVSLRAEEVPAAEKDAAADSGFNQDLYFPEESFLEEETGLEGEFLPENDNPGNDADGSSFLDEDMLSGQGQVNLFSEEAPGQESYVDPGSDRVGTDQAEPDNEEESLPGENGSGDPGDDEDILRDGESESEPEMVSALSDYHADVGSWEELRSALADPVSYCGSNVTKLTLTRDIVADNEHNGQLRYLYNQKIVLELNGHKIDKNKYSRTGSVISVEAGTLTITDKVGGGMITGGYYNPGIEVKPYAECHLEGGKITGNYKSTYGGGVYVYSGGRFYLENDARIEDNSADVGGGIYAMGTVELYGGTICRNSAEYGGGIYLVSNGMVNSRKPNVEISGNLAESYGGGIMLVSGTVTWNQGSIRDNRLTAGKSWGGGICVLDGTLNLGEGRISGNSAQNGGGIALLGGKTTVGSVSMEISGNTASACGGGVMVSQRVIPGMTTTGTLTWNQGSIKGNSAQNGGGLFIDSGTAALNGGVISGNTSTGDGAGLYAAGGDAVLSGGEISGNLTDKFGGGICSTGGNTSVTGTVVTGNKAAMGSGICIGAGGEFRVSGNIQIYENPSMGIVGYMGCNIYLMDLTSRLTVSAPLTLPEERKLEVAMESGHDPAFTKGYGYYHSTEHPEKYFISRNPDYQLCKADGEASLVKKHDEKIVWTWKSIHEVSASSTCGRCGKSVWTQNADKITGPVYDPVQGGYVFTAELSRNWQVYRDSILIPGKGMKIPAVEPTISEDGGYVYGEIEHYRLENGNGVFYFAVNKDGSVGKRLTEEDLVLSRFSFNGNTVERYTGQVQGDSSSFTVSLPKYYTDKEGKKVEIRRIGNGKDAFFTCGRYMVACTENIEEVAAGAFRNCGFAGFTGNTTGLTVIGAEAFAGNSGTLGELILDAEKPVAVSQGAFNGYVDGSGRILLTVSVKHASGIPDGEHGTGWNRYRVQYTDPHEYILDTTRTTWSEGYTSAVLTLKCKNECSQSQKLEEVPVTWVERENDILYTASAEYEGKTYSDTLTGEKMTVVLTTGNVSGEDKTVVSPKTYVLPSEVEGVSPEEENGAVLTWENAGITYLPGDQVILTESPTVFRAVWKSTWKSVSDALATGGTVYLNNDIRPEKGEAFFDIPQGIKSTLYMNGHKIDRKLTAAVNDGFVFRVGGELEVKGDGIVAGGSNTGNGGAFFLTSTGKLSFTNVVLDGNKAANGGGVFLSSGSYLYMTGALFQKDEDCRSRIINNTAASRGGGVYVSNNSRFRIDVGIIERNYAGIEGGGVYVEEDGVLEIGGEGYVKIKNNTSQEDDRDNAWVVAVATGLVIGAAVIAGVSAILYIGLGTEDAGAVAAGGTGAAGMIGDGIEMDIKPDGEKFKNRDGADEEEEKKKCNHSYNQDAWVWDEAFYDWAEVVLSCRKCGKTHKEKDNTVTNREEGKQYVYTARVFYDSKEYTDSKTVHPYNVTLKAGFDNKSENHEAAHKKGKPGSFELPECPWEREGYEFDGWKVDGKTHKKGTVISVESDTTATAEWKKEVTVTFDKGADDAEGSMDETTKTEGDVYILPKCDFTREDYTFDCWKLEWEESDSLIEDMEPKPEKGKPGDMIRLDSDVKAVAQWKQNPVPAFKGHSLVLTGKLGVTFGVDFQDPENEFSELFEDSFMIFTVHGNTTRVDTKDAGNAGDGRRLYTVYVDALMMAETIRAEFHYGKDKTVTQEYSVEKYIKYFDENSSEFSRTTMDVVHAVADYGHYTQPYLSDYNGWTYGVDYETMSTYYTSSFDEETVKAGVSGYQFDVDAGSSALGKVYYSIRLDSETALSVYMSVKDKTPLTASASLNGKAFHAEQQPDGRYRIRVEGINASQLGDTIMITGSAGGDFRIKVSVLAYIRSLLNSSEYQNNLLARNMAMSLYYYYDKTIAFRTSMS